MYHCTLQDIMCIHDDDDGDCDDNGDDVDCVDDDDDDDVDLSKVWFPWIWLAH